MLRDDGFDIDVALHEAHLSLRDGTPVLIRRLVAEDAALYPDFLSDVTAEDLQLRFFGPMREVSHELLDKLIHHDPGLCHGLYCRLRAKPKDARRGAPARRHKRERHAEFAIWCVRGLRSTASVGN